MALFKFRSGNDPASQGSPPADNIEVIRKKARQRLIGSAVLVLVAVVGFPMLFDSQPRPVPVDIAIEIPDKNKVKPLALPAPTPVLAPTTTASAVTATVASQPALQAAAPAAPPAASSATPGKPAAKVTATASLDAKEELLPAKPPLPAKPLPVAKPVPVPPVVAAPSAVAKADDGARARALLEDKPVDAAPLSSAAPAAASGGRFVVQVGAFSDAAKAREVRLKLEKAGLKTYTQVVDSAEGKRTRVRVGPFDNKADASAAFEKIKGLDLPGSVLIL